VGFGELLFILAGSGVVVVLVVVVVVLVDVLELLAGADFSDSVWLGFKLLICSMLKSSVHKV